MPVSFGTLGDFIDTPVQNIDRLCWTRDLTRGKVRQVAASVEHLN